MRATPAMRASAAALGLGLVGLIAAASPAAAYEIRAIYTTPTETAPGFDPVLLDIYLDTQGQSDIRALNVAIEFDARVVAYRPDLSGAAHDDPLYVPGIGKLGTPTWLVSTSDPPALSALALPPNRGQVDLGFRVNSFPDGATSATATNLWLGTIAFEPISPGWAGVSVGFGRPGTSFVLGDGTDVQAQVAVVGGVGFFVGPEPSTALLLGLGLLGLGASRRRDRGVAASH